MAARRPTGGLPYELTPRGWGVGGAVMWGDYFFLELIERLLSLDEGSLKPLGPGECPVRFEPGGA